MSTENTKTCSSFSLLPRDLTIDILSKLPFASVLRCKAVCKEWFEIITSDPFFAKTHYGNSFMGLVCPKAIFDGYKLLEPFWFDGSWDGFVVANSCKGFLLMEELVEGRNVARNFVVYNPLTNEKAFVPKLETWMDHSSSSVNCGLGFSPVTKQFKVVVFVYDCYQKTCSLQIHTVGVDRAWRTVSLANGDVLKDGAPVEIPIDLNGFLHWKTSTERVVRFDMEKEELSQMSTPYTEEYSTKYVTSLGVYKGLLYLGIVGEHHSSGEAEIWVMKDYGVNQSWIQFVVVKDASESNDSLCCDSIKIVDILDNGEIIFLSNQYISYDLLSYDPIHQKLSSLHSEYLEIRTENIIDLYTPSFFCLKDL